MSSDLVIVYHRQPYEEVEVDGKTEYRENKSPNGIVPTLKGFFGRVEHGAWVAWKHAEDPSNPQFDRVVEMSDSYGTYSVSRLPLTPQQVSSFYHVTSKEAFWPILHSFKEKYNYDPVDWPIFREVNWAFAEAAAAEAAEGAVVWVHDYNLWLVPAYLRKLRPDVRISFFHHTPFPAADTFNVLPWRREIIESLLACDVVGFHIPRFSANFVQVAQSLLDVEIVERRSFDVGTLDERTALSEPEAPTRIRHDGRDIMVAATAVGVDVDYIIGRASADATQARARAIRDELGESQMILSVGRTDYTKGGTQQLESFERFLEAQPDKRGKIRLMHVSVQANRNMRVYRNVQDEIEQVAGRINGKFGTFEWQPVALISRAIPFDELVAYYCAADVLWITPLADGMNLVCKEFAASRLDGDGVLILSEFAGAAVDLSSSVLVNPFSHRSMDKGIDIALSMPEDERRIRMAQLRESVRRNDIREWANVQMRLFDHAGDGPNIRVA
jgi:glucosylglycerol-phosphate synthase